LTAKRISGICLRVFLVLAAVRAGLRAQELTESSFERWRDSVKPTAEELSWQAIPWRPTFWEGVVEAQEKERPLLFWTMNGHPLGCT
jgi:hypothetical protein